MPLIFIIIILNLINWVQFTSIFCNANLTPAAAATKPRSGFDVRARRAVLPVLVMWQNERTTASNSYTRVCSKQIPPGADSKKPLIDEATVAKRKLH